MGGRLARAGCIFSLSMTAGVFVALISRPAMAAPIVQTTEDQPTNAWLLVLAVLLVATAIQLLIEIFWSYSEWLLVNLAKWRPSRLKAFAYLRFKGATSLMFGALVGVLVANATGMGLFAYLQPFLPTFVDGVPAAVDVLVTGLLIGALTAPIHDFFGIIAQLKNMAASNAIKQREVAADALASGVLKLAQSEAQATVDIPGIGPARLPTPGVEAEDATAGAASKSAAERYADLLDSRTAG